MKAPATGVFLLYNGLLYVDISLTKARDIQQASRQRGKREIKVREGKVNEELEIETD